MYEQDRPARRPRPDPQQAAGATADAAKDDDVIDAEFEEKS